MAAITDKASFGQNLFVIHLSYFSNTKKMVNKQKT